MERSSLTHGRKEPSTHWSVTVLLFLFSAIALYNASVHPATIGYDAPGHLSYVETLSTFHLPLPSESDEFFSPPLAYALPAALLAMHVPSAIRLGQIAQVFLSIAIMIYVCRLSELIRPSNSAFQLVALMLCGTLPVYYKTFCQIRGEPYVAFLCMFVLYEVTRAFERRVFSLGHSAVLGIGCGLLILARQWGVLVLMGLAIFSVAVAIRRTELRIPLVKSMTMAFVIAFAVGGWFYLGLYLRHSSVLAFYRPQTGFAMSNQPAAFYVGTGNGMLFRDPVRPSFPNQLWPIFYSETWGDYWCYFLVYGFDSSAGRFLRGGELERALHESIPGIETNRSEIAPYLGRVNLVSLVPTLVFIAGLVFGMSAFGRSVTAETLDRRRLTLGLLAAVVVASGLGYVWFLVAYPNLGKGDTIKATYMLHVFPLLALLGSEAVLALRERSDAAFRALVCVLALVAVHNSGALFTRVHGPVDIRALPRTHALAERLRS